MNYRLAPLWAATVLTVVPMLAYAQGAVSAKGTEVALVPCTGVNCDMAAFAKLIQNLLNFGIFLASVIAALLFAYAGWLYLSNSINGGEASVKQAKSLFINVGVGYLLILGAWLIVDTLLGTLLGNGFSWNVLG